MRITYNQRLLVALLNLYSFGSYRLVLVNWCFIPINLKTKNTTQFLNNFGDNKGFCPLRVQKANNILKNKIPHYGNSSIIIVG